MSIRTLLTAALALLLGGCAGLGSQHEFEPAAPQAMQVRPMPPPPSALEQRITGSIYGQARVVSLFEDRTARRVGDILTIRLTERTQASKDASTTISKDSEAGIESPTLFGEIVEFGTTTLGTPFNLGSSFGGSRSSTGSGEADQSNQLSGTLTAVVTGVYPNGYLMIRGEKMLTLNQGDEFVQITGVVRPDDIEPDNTIVSTRVADARITYAGSGGVADANAAGWLVRFFLHPLWPF